MKGAWMAWCSSSRVGALQLWPQLKNTLPKAACTARSRSGQSSKTMNGDLPPSSVQARLRLLCPAMTWICLPTRVLPVKAMQSTSGCSASGLPASGPKPGSTLSTPGGRPACSPRSAKRRALKGDFSLGLSTTALPAASAGAIFQTAISSG